MEDERVALFGQERLEEIKRVERKLSIALRDLTIRNAGNLSYFEVYAAAIRAVEGLAHTPAECIRDHAREVSAKCRLKTDFADALYRQHRDAFVAESASKGKGPNLFYPDPLSEALNMGDGTYRP